MAIGPNQETVRKILIVDDDETFRQGLARILAGHGYATDQAGSAAEARAHLTADTAIDAVLSDIRMPGESGIDLLAQIAADSPEVAVIMTTGVDDPRTAEVAFNIGADGYLIKPFTTNEILITLSNSLNRRQMEITRRSHLREMESVITRLRTLNTVLQQVQDAAIEGGADADTIELLARAVSLRDEETGGHIERMSRYAALLAETIGYRNGNLEQIRLAAALHDVGKIGVPDVILLKPGSLSPDEYTTMQRHAQMGYQLIDGAATGVLASAAQIALGHHEWWDGGGYPNGLRGDQVPQLARIAAVADVFDALTSDRIYRAAMPVDQAASVMTELRGRQFEPRLLDAFFDASDDAAAIRATFPDLGEGESRVRVLVVDDHEIFVQSLVRLLSAQPNLKVVGSARSVAEARHAAVAYEPDVVLMDFELPDGDGIVATEHIRATAPYAKVVMLTGQTDPDLLVRAIHGGCAGFVTKTEPVETLLDAIRAVHEGESLTPIVELPTLLANLSPTRRARGTNLTPREIEILTLVTAGLANKAVAQRLDVTLNTVRNHVQNILYKLDAHSRLEAVAIGVREGLVERLPDTSHL